MGVTDFWLGQAFHPEDQYRALVEPIRQQLARVRQPDRQRSVSSTRFGMAEHLSARQLATRGLSFDQLRPYIPGDEARRIDWNVYARQQQPYIRLYEPEGEEALWFVLDVSPSMTIAPVNHALPLAQAFDWMVQCVAQRPQLALGRSGAMLLSASGTIPLPAARLHLVQWLEKVRAACLTLLESSTPNSFDATAFYASTWPAALASLKTRDAGIVWLSDWLEVPDDRLQLLRHQLRSKTVWTPDFMTRSSIPPNTIAPPNLILSVASVERPHHRATVLSHWPQPVGARPGPFSCQNSNRKRPYL